MLDCEPEEAPAVLKRKLHIDAVVSGPVTHARHVFTHLIWEMDVLPMEAPLDLQAPTGYRWVPLDELDTLAFPVAMNVPLALARA